jgi:uncharacterized protein (DUF1697 family)
MTYIALLRGINVSGQKLIKMEELRKIFEDTGFKNVRTYIQSGNVIFDAPKTKNESLAAKIEEHLNKVFGYEVKVVVRTAAEVEEIVKNYPFGKVKDHDNCKIYVSFLEAEPDKNKAKELASLSSDGEMFHIKGVNVYLLCRKNFMDSLISKNIVEKTLKVKSTTRNWNTVNKLLTL